LTQVSIEKEGKTPTSKQLARLIRIAGELRIKVLFVQPQFSAKSAQSIADAIGGKLVPADPLSPDWAANLRLVASQFREAVR
jgi:zinc transport system substrate-binding protein